MYMVYKGLRGNLHGKKQKETMVQGMHTFRTFEKNQRTFFSFGYQEHASKGGIPGRPAPAFPFRGTHSSTKPRMRGYHILIMHSLNAGMSQ